jgi:kinesin family member 11
VGRSGAEGAMAKEAGNINKSLLTLGRVINALAMNEPHIPYRDSKLTRLTSEALGGVCKTSFVATITPSAGDVSETLSTLRYAKNAMEALNVSQLPLWKQNEIMVEHLTRKCAALEYEMKEEEDRHRVSAFCSPFCVLG